MESAGDSHGILANGIKNKENTPRNSSISCFSFFVSLCVADYMKSPTLSIVPYLDIQGLRYLPFNKATKVFAF